MPGRDLVRGAMLDARRLISSGRVRTDDPLRTTLTQIARVGEAYEVRETEISIVERPPAISVPEYASR